MALSQVVAVMDMLMHQDMWYTHVATCAAQAVGRGRGERVLAGGGVAATLAVAALFGAGGAGRGRAYGAHEEAVLAVNVQEVLQLLLALSQLCLSQLEQPQVEQGLAS